ncbi:MAG: hypothetical protein GKC04_08110 [Methanomicrobiales archaeon]|nr:hypothetical protein [Methanomicrobiales archaeon]
MAKRTHLPRGAPGDGTEKSPEDPPFAGAGAPPPQVTAASLPEARIPDWLVRFIAEIAAGTPPACLLDPFAGAGGLLAPLDARLGPERAVGICESEAQAGRARRLFPESAAVWKVGGTVPPGTADLVATCLPADAAGAPFPASEAVRLLAVSAAALTAEGMVIALVPCDPDMPGTGPALLAGCSAAGLAIDAVLGIGGGVLLVARKRLQGPILVGEIIPDQGHMDILRTNIRLSREGKDPRLGVREAPDAFSSVAETLLLAAVTRHAADAGCRPVALSSVAAEIGTAGEDGESGNAVYFVPGRPVATAPPAGGAAGAVRVSLDPDRASAAYVVRHFATRAGRTELALARVRAKAFGWEAAVAGMPVCLPPREIQNRVLAVRSTLSHLASRIEALEGDLWDHPFGWESIAKEAGVFLQGETIDAWIESLPFPLASILWAYRAEPDPVRRTDHLFHFFEALAEFHAIIMASALFPLCAGRTGRLLDEDPYFRDAYRFATFRAWIVLARRLAQVTRGLLGSRERRNEVLRLYHGADPRFLAMLTSRRLFAVLDTVADERNAWKAHGGIVSSKDAENRLCDLEASLADIRRMIGTHYADAALLVPGAAVYHDGVFAVAAEELAGSHMVFRSVQVESTVPMDTGRLYLLFAGRQTPLELLPFVRLAAGEHAGMRAFYFYNRLEKDDVRWVCYHPGGDADLVSPDPGVRESLEALGLLDGEAP